MDVNFSNGYVSDYEVFYLWVEEFKVGAKAAYIAKDEDGEAVSYTPAEVLKLADRSDYDSEADFDNAYDEMNADGDMDALANFFSPDGIFYASVKFTGDEEEIDSFDLGDANYC